MMIGKIISHYKIIEKLGEGGMGQVYLAEDTELHRKAALKFLSSEFSSDAEFKARFKREAQATAALNHPNIVTVYEVAEAEDGAYIAMEYVEGQSLKELIEALAVDAKIALDFFLQICLGLGKAHQAGIVHRDIKPANIMVDKEGCIKILDFGLAKLAGASQLTKSGTMMGTVSYMSPEQLRGGTLDERSDIFSSGVVFYELLTHQHPFIGDSEAAIIYCVVNEHPKPLSEYAVKVAPEFQKIVDKMLQKNPESRYQKIKDVLVDLKHLGKKIPTLETKSGGVENAIAETKTLYYKPEKKRIYKLFKPTERRPSQRKRWYLYAGLGSLLILILIGLFTFSPFKQPRQDKIRLAVLPFDNITQNPEDEYFADGMTDEMISKLSQIAGIGVIARTSVMRYKTASKSISEIGQELRVSKILEGSVRKAGDKLRITVQLVDVKTQEPIWSNDYDREVADVFAIQSDVAQRVVLALLVELSLTEKRQIEKHGTDNVEGYKLYLQGHYYANKFTLEGINKGVEYFNEAIKIDPEFAGAYAGLAKCYHLLATFGYSPPTDVFPKANDAAIRALAIDNTLTEGHGELAGVLFRFDWDWSGAESRFKQTVELAPGSPKAHRLYGSFLTWMGRFDEALIEIERSLELDPLYLESHTNEGIVLYNARRYDQAIEKLNKTIEMEPNYFIAYLWLSLSYLEKGMIEEAMAAIQKYTTLTRGDPIGVAAQGYIFARSGKRNEALKIVDRLQQVSQQRYLPPLWITLIYSGLGERQQAFEWLEKAYEARDSNLVQIKVSPLMDNLRSDLRFTAFLKKMGFEE